MSDELPPPPLRLKPRLKPETEIGTDAPESSSKPTSTEPPSPQVELPRLKLRPKLDAPIAPPPHFDQSAPAALPAHLSAVPVVTAPPESPAVETHPPAASVPSEPPKFKLKDKSAAAISASPAAPPFVPATTVAPATAPMNGSGATTPPVFPVVARASSASPASLPPPIPKQTQRKNPPRASTQNRSPSSKLIVLAAAVVLLAAAYFGYGKLMSSSTPAVAESPNRPATPSKTLNAIGAAPAQAIRNAEAVVAEASAQKGAGAKDVLGEENSAASVVRTSATEKPVAPITSTTQLAPGLSARTTASGVQGDASPAFRNWVAQARVSGVFQGTPARILINGRMVTSGQLVDETLVITFEGIDAGSSSLVFRDRTGASVARRF